MAKRLIVASFLAIMFIACDQKTQPADNGKEHLNDVCNTIMTLFSSGKIDEAMNLLKKSSILASSSVDTLEKTINMQKEEYFPSYGKMLGSEFIVERNIKTFLAKRFYVLKFERYYLKFSFTLYKSPGNWTITGFKYDEDINELFY